MGDRRRIAGEFWRPWGRASAPNWYCCAGNGNPAVQRAHLTNVVKSVLLLLVLSCAGGAQYPGQYPPGGYPPGSYPPGTYPPGQGPGSGGVSLPSKNKKGKSSEDTIKQPVIAADGHTVSNDGKKLIVKVDDGRTLTMTIVSRTRWTRSNGEIEPSKIE